MDEMRTIEKLLNKQFKDQHRHSFKHDPERPGQSREARKARESRIRQQRYVPQSWAIEAMSEAEARYWHQQKENRN